MNSMEAHIQTFNESIKRLEDRQERHTERLHERFDELKDTVNNIQMKMPQQPCRDVQDLQKKQHETEARRRLEDQQKSGAFWGVVQKVAGWSITAGLGAAGAWVAMKVGLK